MTELKSAYELGLERIISSKNQKEEKKEGFDFIPIPEFDDREDKVIEIPGYTDCKEKVGTNETKFIEETEDMPEEKIKVEENSTIHYDQELLKCHFAGSTKNYSGYSKMNRNIIFGLSNRGVMVKVEDVSDSIEINLDTQKQIQFFENNDIPSDAPKIYSMTVPNSVTHDGKKIAYTMIESSTLHKDYIGKLNLMDEIWVPSKFGEKVLKNSKVYPPIFVMP